MEKITFHLAKKEGESVVRYRLREGRAVQICHTSDIKCRVEDLEKIDVNGDPMPRVKVYNLSLATKLKDEYSAMVAAYHKMKEQGLDLTTAVWEQQIKQIKNPIQEARAEVPRLVQRFKQYAENSLRDGIIGENRKKHIIVVADKLDRFLIIEGISGITAPEFTETHLLEFRNFLFDEYLYVTKYPVIYKKVSNANKPSARLSMNTVVSQMKMLQTFFNELENSDEIVKSPFRKLGREKKKTVMRTMYDDPYFLRKEELQIIMKAKVPEKMQDTRDAFLVQCALGCRIGDFQRMSMRSIAVSENGIPYIRYIPKKTVGTLTANDEVRTPLLRFAFDIIMRTGFNFPILKNAFGEFGYNANIKGLLQACKIDREVAEFNEETKENNYIPIYKVGSSKLARKTHVDIMSKVQIDLYASGLHKKGSSAVKRYTSMELRDRFALMNIAFDQKPYKVNKNLEIL